MPRDQHYRPKKGEHRGYALGGGYIHPAADLHHARQQAKADAEFQAMLDRSGRRDEYERVAAEIKAARVDYEALVDAEVPRTGGPAPTGPVADRMWAARDAYYAVVESIEHTDVRPAQPALFAA